MINCPECGRQLPDDARFCFECGQPCNRTALHVQKRTQLNVAQTVPTEMKTKAMPRVETPSVSQSSCEQDNRSNSKPRNNGFKSIKKTFGARGIVGIVIAVLLVAVLGGAIWRVSVDKRASYDERNASRQVSFQIDAPKYEAGVDSPIPIRIVGSELDGGQVDKIVYVTPANPAMSLPRGSYTATVAASPLMMRGMMYEIPENGIELNVGDSDLSGSSLSLSFADANMANVTDDEIDEAFKLAQDSNMESGRAKALRDAVLDARQKALDAQRSAEEEESARKAQEAENREYDAQRTYQDEYVTMMLPSSWVGNCVGSVGYDGSIFQTNMIVSGGSFVLLSVSGIPGDFGSYSVTYINSATEIWDQAHGADGYSEWELDQALALQTGFALTRDDVLACANGWEAEALGERYIGPYMESTIGPTISAT